MNESKDTVRIRTARETDASAIAAIYNPFIESSIVTFEEQPITAEDMAARIRNIQQASLPWIVAVIDEKLVGYAYAAPWRPRDAYRFSVELSAYVSPDFLRRGIGSRLYAALLPELKRRNVRVLIGGVALPNDASVVMLEKAGFEKVAHFREVGYKLGRWIDVAYWQRKMPE